MIKKNCIYKYIVFFCCCGVMVKKLKSSTCSSGWCKNHIFEIKPLNNAIYSKKKVKLRLCPKYNKCNKNYEQLLPIFNRDKKYYTPSFILDQEIKFYNQNDQRMKNNHKTKVQQEQAENSTIVSQKKKKRNNLKPNYFKIILFIIFFLLIIQWVAKHGRQNNYCSVCKEDYTDYLEHVELPTHQKMLRNNRFTAFISQTAAKYKQIHILETQAQKDITKPYDESEDHELIKKNKEIIPIGLSGSIHHPICVECQLSSQKPII